MYIPNTEDDDRPWGFWGTFLCRPIEWHDRKFLSVVFDGQLGLITHFQTHPLDHHAIWNCWFVWSTFQVNWQFWESDCIYLWGCFKFQMVKQVWQYTHDTAVFSHVCSMTRNGRMVFVSIVFLLLVFFETHLLGRFETTSQHVFCKDVDGRTQMCYVFLFSHVGVSENHGHLNGSLSHETCICLLGAHFQSGHCFFGEDGSEVCTTPAVWECVGGFSSIPTSSPWICRTIQARQPYTGQVLLAFVLKFSKILPLRHCIAAGPEQWAFVGDQYTNRPRTF